MLSYWFINRNDGDDDFISVDDTGVYAEMQQACARFSHSYLLVGVWILALDY